MTPGRSRTRLLTFALASVAVASAFLAAGAFARNLYVASEGSNSLYVINGLTNQVIGAPIAVHSSPQDVAITPDGTTAYVANEGSADVSVVDLQTRQAVGAPIPVGNGPDHVAITPDGRTLYVLNEVGDSVSVISTQTKQVIGTIPLADPAGIAIAPDGKFAYVTSFETDSVSVIDTQANQVVGPPIAVGNGADAIAIAPGGAVAYVSDFLESSLTVIDLSTKLAVAPPIQLGAGNPDSIAFSPDGGTAYVTHLEEEQVSVLDTASRTLRTVVQRGPRLGFAVDIALSGDGRTAYVANLQSNNVTAIDTQANRVLGAPIPVGVGAAAIAIAPLDLPPVASFAPPPVARLGAPVSFDASASYDADGSVATYSWGLGDGSKPPASAAATSHAFTRVGTYKTTLTVTDNEGCSTAPVSNGPALNCHGSALATEAHDVKVVYPAVRVKCPGKAGKKGCAFTLQGVTKKRKGTIETKLAKVKVKAGKTKIAPLKPEPHFIAKLGVASVVLVKETLTIGGSERTTFRRLLIR